MESWKEYFASSESDIFLIIENAILVAARDNPEEFQLRRDQIAERLFSCLPTAAPLKESSDEKTSEKAEFIKYNDKKSEDEKEMNEDLEENKILQEVLQIKEIVVNSKGETELHDSLERLKLMALSVDILEKTGIGKAIKLLGKHSLKKIRISAKTLIEGWKAMVHEWCAAEEAIEKTEGGTPHSVNPSVGIPYPLTEFSDDMDEDGKPQKSGKLNKGHENLRKRPVETVNVREQKQRLLPPERKENEPQTVVPNTGTDAKPPKTGDLQNHVIARPTKPRLERKSFDGRDEDENPQNSRELNKSHENIRKRHVETRVVREEKQRVKKPQTAVPETGIIARPGKPPLPPKLKFTIRRRPLDSQQNKSRCPDKDDATQAKVEILRRAGS